MHSPAQREVPRITFTVLEPISKLQLWLFWFHTILDGRSSILIQEQQTLGTLRKYSNC